MFFKIPKKEELADEKELLKKIALGKLNYLSKKRFNKKTIDEIYWILKISFKSYFKISKEFTYTELIKKVEKKRIDGHIKQRVINLINFFLDANYREKRYTTKSLRKIVKEAKDIIKII